MTATVERLLRRTPRSITVAPVFLGSDGKPAKASWVSEAFRTTCRKAGIKNLRLHDLRHDFASRLTMGGTDLLTVKEYLGHKTLSMTERYSHLTPDHKARAIRILDEEVDTLVDTRHAEGGKA